ncbi:hypothetical protein DNTS_002768 [Danionella cerebrum]|uniref:Uncharacterized protein n=1 Tax=Danionella cerebrum TaxID=2873325 RepID=A0A553MKV7_9TELE|nr:hypothetical protein DNTS_002768 [Danionella translucida]
MVKISFQQVTVQKQEKNDGDKEEIQMPPSGNDVYSSHLILELLFSAWRPRTVSYSLLAERLIQELCGLKCCETGGGGIAHST